MANTDGLIWTQPFINGMADKKLVNAKDVFVEEAGQQVGIDTKLGMTQGQQTDLNNSIKGLSVSQTATGVAITPNKTGGGNATAINIGAASSTQAGLMTPSQLANIPNVIAVPASTFSESQLATDYANYTDVLVYQD